MGEKTETLKMKIQKPPVGIIMGSDSDLPVMQEAAVVLDEFNIPYEITIVSAHRTPGRMFEYAKTAVNRGLKVIIAGAGGAAHLPGMTASLTTIPVIGVPVQTKSLSGVDSLYSIVQMPPGIPVATVAINAAKNAGLLAVEILATADSSLQKKLEKYREELKHSVIKKADKLGKIGSKKYLKTQIKTK
jgi:5-(carboxyamino)imidazole ribonucleotide mutase